MLASFPMAHSLGIPTLAADKLRLTRHHLRLAQYLKLSTGSSGAYKSLEAHTILGTFYFIKR